MNFNLMAGCRSAEPSFIREKKKNTKWLHLLKYITSSNYMELMGQVLQFKSIFQDLNIPFSLLKCVKCPCTTENYTTTILQNLNKGNIAQFSIVKHVTEINVYSFNSLFYALFNSRIFFVYCYCPTFPCTIWFIKT